MNLRMKLPTMAALSVALLFLGPVAAYAQLLKLQISDGTNTVYVGPNGSGVASYTGTVGQFSVQLSPVLGSPYLNSPGLSLTGVIKNTGTSPGSLTIEASDATQIAYQPAMTVTSLMTLTTISGVTTGQFTTLYDANNKYFTGTQLCTFNILTGPVVAHYCHKKMYLPNYSTDPYSTSVITQFTMDAGSTYGFTAGILPVPEPYSLPLLSTGLLGLVLLSRGRKANRLTS